MKTPGGPARKLAALVLGTLAALLLAEGIVRLVEKRAPAAGSEIDRAGGRRLPLRKRRPKPQARRGDFRILVVGDSFTVGAAYPEDETYPRRLAELLGARFGWDAFEVLTLATTGWNTEEEVNIAGSYVAELEPDLILVGVCLNDPEPSERALLRRHLQEAGLRGPPRSEEGWLYRSSAAVRLGVDRYRAWRSMENVHRYYRSFYDEELPSWRAFQDALRRFRDLAREHRAQLVLAVFPLLDSPLDRRYPYRDLHEKIGKEAREEGIETLDLFPFYEGMDYRALQVTPTDPHPSALAHRIAAERIFEYLEAEGLLSKRRQGRTSATGSRVSGKSRGARRSPRTKRSIRE